MPFFRNPRTHLELILDIQSAVVRSALVSMPEDAPPCVYFVHTLPIPYRPRQDSGYLIKTTLRAVKETVGESLQELSTLRERLPEGQGHPRISRKLRAVHCILSSPWIISQAKTVSVDFPSETVVTEKMVADIVAKERSRSAPDSQTDTITPIEEKIFYVRLNGYSINTWRGKKAKNLEVSFATSLAGERMMERFRGMFRSVVRESRVHFHSSLLLQHIGIERVLPNKSSYALIHAHDELTDVVVIKHRSCVFFGSYPIGIRTITRTLSHSAKIDERTADSALTLYARGELDSNHSKALVETIGKPVKGWALEFDKLIRKEQSVGAIPTDIILSARVHNNLFLRGFRETHPRCRTELLDLSAFDSHIVFREGIERLRILGLCTIGIHTIDTHVI